MQDVEDTANDQSNQVKGSTSHVESKSQHDQVLNGGRREMQRINLLARTKGRHHALYKTNIVIGIDSLLQSIHLQPW